MSQDTTHEAPNLQTTRVTDGLLPDSPHSLLVPGLVIAGHPDSRRIGEQAALPGLVSGKAVSLSRLEPEFSSPSGLSRLRPLNDPYLSRRSLSLRPGPDAGSIHFERSGSRTRVVVGVEELAEQRLFSTGEVQEGVVLTLGGRVVLLLQLVDPLPTDLPSYGLVGDSLPMRRLRRDVRTAATLATSALLRGETGTGKELVARALHEHGPRSNSPFVSVNMAALPPTLAASELFGAARGAYTGADRKKEGFFHKADGGTLFLDEIGETPPEVQAMLLRALETNEILAVGSVEPQKVDVRIVAATDANLERAIESGSFRAPLLHRLAGYELRLPALRERRDDIARLLFHFLTEELTARGRPDLLGNPEAPFLPADQIARLTCYSWPGNVRQLRNVARRLTLAHHGGQGGGDLATLLDDLLAEASAPSPHRGSTPSENHSRETRRGADSATTGPATSSRYRRAHEVDEEELVTTLRTHGWNLRTTAEALGVSRPTLYRLIDACAGIRKASELGRDEIEAAFLAANRDANTAAKNLEVSPQGFKRRLTELGLV